jgi:predicted O-linked N-acetylglucosamine transferase (SPINDLY family)
MNDTLLKNAYSLHQAGKLAEAASLYGEVLKTQPLRFDALYPLGLAHLQRGEFTEAARVLEEATRINASAVEAHAARGTALSQLGRHADALAAYDRAIALKPGQAPVWNNRGNALIQLGRAADAVESYDRALAIRPDHPDGWRHRGIALSLLERGEEALASFDKALALKKDYADALEDKGNLLMRLQRHAEAEAAYAKAITVKPSSADLHYNRANALSILKRYGEAIAECRNTLALNPDYPYARGVLIHSMLQCCDWRSLEEEKTQIAAALKSGKRAVSPFNHKAISDSPEDQLRCARVWVANERPEGIKPLPHKTFRHDRIRLAYVSADFNASAVATSMAGVFERHDRNRFEAIAISFGTTASTPMRARLEAAFDRFIDVRAKSDADIAALIRDLEIDIAVDLMGYTGECRSWILARRPAPLQVNFLGFPGTMGADHIDYILADKTAIPEESQIHYAEKVAYLPDCYLPSDSARAIAAQRPTREQIGLPKEGFVFASFNNAYKFTPAMFDIWMRLLDAVPGSVLWLPKSHPAALANLTREAEARGIAAGRLVFANPVQAPEDHLARLSLADLFLDTLPYNAHSTAIDALWAGVPVLTSSGISFQARVAASLNKALDLPELIALSLSEYERMALHLAREPEALATIRDKLARNRNTTPLFDTDRFARHLEAAFITMWERHRRGEPPQSFSVHPS